MRRARRDRRRPCRCASTTRGRAASRSARFPAGSADADLPLRVRLGHPAEPLPLSGIRGYAAAIDANPSGSPCAAPDLCGVLETTLSGGIGDDELAIAEPPEGASYLHVAAVSGAGIASPAEPRGSPRRHGRSADAHRGRPARLDEPRGQARGDRERLRLGDGGERRRPAALHRDPRRRRRPRDRLRRHGRRKRHRRGCAPRRLLRPRRGRQRRRRRDGRRRSRPPAPRGLGADRSHAARCRLPQLAGPARPRADPHSDRRPAFGSGPEPGLDRRPPRRQRRPVRAPTRRPAGGRRAAGALGLRRRAARRLRVRGARLRRGRQLHPHDHPCETARRWSSPTR